MKDITVLTIPGLYDSSPGHWQSLWEERDPTIQRVVQSEWELPNRADWVSCLDAAVIGVRQPVVLVAHSTGCPLIAHWAVSASPVRHLKVRGALLVAPSDPEGPNYPAGPVGFAPVPMVRLPFPSVVVASSNDPYCSPERSHAYASAWGSRYVEVEGGGHLNLAAGYGEWPEGWALLEALRSAPLPDEWLPSWLADEASLDAFLASFHDGTFPITWWTHGAHVGMASAVLWSTSVPQALDLIREAIKRYNTSQGGHNTDSSGYHETLTRLWIGALASSLSTLPPGTTRLEAVRRMYRAYARRSAFFRDWYSIDLLKSQPARRGWVAPDLELTGAAGAIFAPHVEQ
ncbi:MAG TPA: alpha/beta hydrolase [Gemmatimonadaceae bacterium]|nr:alpha/beta hydrolase [Gemmatimonadaceae bacterium]